MTESLDALVERILRNGWAFELAYSRVQKHDTPSGPRFVALSYEAEVRSPKGDSYWEAQTPAEALAVALGAVERMNWGDRRDR